MDIFDRLRNGLRSIRNAISNTLDLSRVGFHRRPKSYYQNLLTETAMRLNELRDQQYGHPSATQHSPDNGRPIEIPALDEDESIWDGLGDSAEEYRRRIQSSPVDPRPIGTFQGAASGDVQPVDPALYGDFGYDWESDGRDAIVPPKIPRRWNVDQWNSALPDPPLVMPKTSAGRRLFSETLKAAQYLTVAGGLESRGNSYAANEQIRIHLPRILHDLPPSAQRFAQELLDQATHNQFDTHDFVVYDLVGELEKHFEDQLKTIETQFGKDKADQIRQTVTACYCIELQSFAGDGTRMLSDLRSSLEIPTLNNGDHGL